MTSREPTPAELAAEMLGQYGFTADDIREGIAEGGSISVSFVTASPSPDCKRHAHAMCAEPDCACTCHKLARAFGDGER